MRSVVKIGTQGKDSLDIYLSVGEVKRLVDDILTGLAFKKIAAENECSITLTEDVNIGAKNADVIYTDIWLSMGEPDEMWEKRIKLLKPYQVNKNIMELANKSAIFMHCLPSFHDTNTTVGKSISEKFNVSEMEVTNEVFESKQSVVFDEAENRMHTIKAIMYATLM